MTSSTRPRAATFSIGTVLTRVIARIAVQLLAYAPRRHRPKIARPDPRLTQATVQRCNVDVEQLRRRTSCRGLYELGARCDPSDGSIPNRFVASIAVVPSNPVSFRERVRDLSARYCQSARSLGSRWEEVAALRGNDLDLAANTLNTDETVVRDDHGAPSFAQPKSAASGATVPIPPALASMLPIPSDPEALLFPAPSGGPLRPDNFRSRGVVPGASCLRAL